MKVILCTLVFIFSLGQTYAQQTISLIIEHNEGHLLCGKEMSPYTPPRFFIKTTREDLLLDSQEKQTKICFKNLFKKMSQNKVTPSIIKTFSIEFVYQLGQIQCSKNIDSYGAGGDVTVYIPYVSDLSEVDFFLNHRSIGLCLANFEKAYKEIEEKQRSKEGKTHSSV